MGRGGIRLRDGQVGHRRLHRIGDVLAVLVHSNVLIAVSAASVAVTTMLLAGFQLWVEPPAVVFAATLFVYNLNRFTDRAEDAENLPNRVAFVQRYGWHCLLGATISYTGATVFVLLCHGQLVAVMALPLLVILLYSVAGFQRFLLVKNLLVGLSWGVIPLGVGVYAGQPWHPHVVFLCLWVLSMLTVAAVIFDVKDIVGDRQAGITTVPVRFGPAATRRACQAANVLVALVVIGAIAVGPLSGDFLVLLGYHLYVAGYIRAATPDHGPLFYGGIIDGEHILLAVLALSIT